MRILFKEIWHRPDDAGKTPEGQYPLDFCGDPRPGRPFVNPKGFQVSSQKVSECLFLSLLGKKRLCCICVHDGHVISIERRCLSHHENCETSEPGMEWEWQYEVASLHGYFSLLNREFFGAQSSKIVGSIVYSFYISQVPVSWAIWVPFPFKGPPTILQVMLMLILWRFGHLYRSEETTPAVETPAVEGKVMKPRLVVQAPQPMDSCVQPTGPMFFFPFSTWLVVCLRNLSWLRKDLIEKKIYEWHQKTTVDLSREVFWLSPKFCGSTPIRPRGLLVTFCINFREQILRRVTICMKIMKIGRMQGAWIGTSFCRGRYGILTAFCINCQ